VKGKALPIELFTPCLDDELRKRSEEAISAYREQQWDRAETLWREIVQMFPDDSMAPVYLERVAGFRKESPGDPWDGAVSLEKM
jgi:adenylate cyclase